VTLTAWVTGAHGFIGRHVARECRARGMTVAGVGHGTWDAGEKTRFGLTSWVRGEVNGTSLDLLAGRAPAPQFLFHLAGGSSVGISVAAPDEDFRRTVTSTAELLRWTARVAPGATVVIASSAAVYGGAAGPERIPETHPCEPCSPYGHHKRIAERLGEEFARARGLRVVAVRMFSVYGPHLRKQLLWDLCVRLSKAPETLELTGTGSETRDFLHVEDATRLLVDRGIRAATAEASSSLVTVNGGTGTATSVRELAEGVSKAWGRPTEIRFTGKVRAGDPPRLVADPSRAIADGWSPRVPLREGIAGYVSWFRGVRVPAAS